MARLVALFLLFLAYLTADAALTATNTVSLQSIAGTPGSPATVNGNSFALGNVTIPSVNYFMQNTGLANAANAPGQSNTNAFHVAIQLSFDNSNWTTVTNYYPATTNSTVELFNPSLNPITIYVRTPATTTNTLSVGVTSVRVTQ